MKDELKSIKDNDVWDLVELPEGKKPICSKKNQAGSKGNVERYKSHLVIKGFTQREGIDYKETFSLVFMKHSFRIIMALVAYVDVELHQIDIKIVFLNGSIEKEICMVQFKNFKVKVS